MSGLPTADPAAPAVLGAFLRDAARRRPDHVALVDGALSPTFADLHAAAAALAGRFVAAGVAPGDRVMALMGNSVAFAVVLWATQLARAGFVPLHPDTRADKLGWLIEDCTPRVLVADAALWSTVETACSGPGATPALFRADAAGIVGGDETAPPVDRVGEAEPEDLAAIIYTSGSTGRPKGVTLTQRNMTTAARSVSRYLGYAEDERIYCAIPFTFDYGLHQLTMSALVGCTVLVEAGFSKPLLNLLRLVREKATAVPLVPTMAALIEPFATRFDFSAVRIVTNTAAALPPRSIDAVRGMFPKARLFSMYGLTECHRCTYLDPAELDRRKASVGKAIPMTELWVVDEDGVAHHADATGELVIRGDTVMRGYWNNPEATARRLKPGPLPGETVLYTGDVCRLDAEGFVFFVGRTDDMLKVRGEKVAPLEIERVLLAYPQVALAAVIGLPDPVLGDRIAAYVEPIPGTAPTAAELRAFCAARLESHSCPRDVHVLDALPKSGNGKIDKLALREAAMAAEPAPRPDRPQSPASDILETVP